MNSAKKAEPKVPKFSGKSAPKIFTPIIAYTYAKIIRRKKVQRTLGIALITAFTIILSFVIPFTNLRVFITRKDFIPLIIFTALKTGIIYTFKPTAYLILFIVLTSMSISDFVLKIEGLN